MTEGTSHEVLVEADDPEVVEVLSTALEDTGYRVRRAYDGHSALEEIERATPDLVVADLVVSGLGGVDLARQLLSRPEPIPVVLMSAAYGIRRRSKAPSSANLSMSVYFFPLLLRRSAAAPRTIGALEPPYSHRLRTFWRQ